MGSSDEFCLRWNSYESNISSSFRELREDSEFFDVTLCCDNGIDIVQAHKVILAACSPLFHDILSHQKSHQNPLLYLKGICLKDLQAVLEFMYHGEVNLAQDSVNNFLEVAEELAIKGLSADTKPMFPTSKKFITTKRKNSLPQSLTTTRIAKRPKTFQVLTPLENKENIMTDLTFGTRTFKHPERKSKIQLQNYSQIEDVERIVCKKSKSSNDMGQDENFEEIAQISKVENTNIKTEHLAKDTFKDYTNGTMETAIADQADFDDKNYNNDISNTIGYHEEFEESEDENEFEDSLGFVEGPEDITDQIETKEGPNKKSKSKRKMMKGGSDDEEKDLDDTENPKLDDKQLEFCQFIRDNCSQLFQAYKPQDTVARHIQYGIAFEESKRLNMKFANEKAMIRNIKYMRTMVTAKCFNNELTTDQKLKAKHQLKEYQKIVYEVIATEKNPNYETNLKGANLENQCVWIEMDKYSHVDKARTTKLDGPHSEGTCQI